MTGKMTSRGVGPKFAALSAIYGMTTVIVNWHFYHSVQKRNGPRDHIAVVL